MKHIDSYSNLKRHRGAITVLSAILMAVLLGFAAFAIDIGNLYVARNELQDAADAGALAGARFLYTKNGQSINVNGDPTLGLPGNPSANQIAYNTAIANQSQQKAVDVNWAAGQNAGSDVERGHWSFGLGRLPRGFTANNSAAPVSLWNVTTVQLDENTNFINAVRVTTRRQATPVTAFFARIFGINNFQLSTQAVAYIGFAGTLAPGEANQPIAICRDKIETNGSYSCDIGRLIPSTSDTGGWTDFNQVNACNGSANDATLKGLVCSSGNPQPITFGLNLSTNNGQLQSAFSGLYDCWAAATQLAANKCSVGYPSCRNLWNLTLPVVECVGNNIAPCSKLVGAVNLNVAWIVDKANKIDDDAPWEILDKDGNVLWNNNSPSGSTRWDSFVTHFNIQLSNNTLATVSNGGWAQKTIYFLPDCTPHIPEGHTGGNNFGILAKIPVLVQ